MSREEMEALALERVDTYHYYDLLDAIHETSDTDLMAIIDSRITH